LRRGQSLFHTSNHCVKKWLSPFNHCVKKWLSPFNLKKVAVPIQSEKKWLSPFNLCPYS
jgi:hypothetical protein